MDCRLRNYYMLVHRILTYNLWFWHLFWTPWKTCLNRLSLYVVYYKNYFYGSFDQLMDCRLRNYYFCVIKVKIIYIQYWWSRLQIEWPKITVQLFPVLQIDHGNSSSYLVLFNLSAQAILSTRKHSGWSRISPGVNCRGRYSGCGELPCTDAISGFCQPAVHWRLSDCEFLKLLLFFSP